MTGGARQRFTETFWLMSAFKRNR